MTATIIRLKRRLTDDSVDSFVLNTKRRKIDTVKSDNNGLSTIFNFVGTGKSLEDVIEHIKKPSQNEASLQAKLDTSNVLKKLKDDWKKNSKSDRFKVVNSFRFSKETEEASSTDAKCMIVDVESNKKDITSDAPDGSEQFVYDFYTTNDFYDEELYDEALENVLSVCPLNMEMFNIRGTDYDDADDTDDSNAENYFANDYPDESEKSDEESDDYDEDDDEESKQFRKEFRQVKLYEESSSDCDSEENFNLARSDFDEYDCSCTP